MLCDLVGDVRLTDTVETDDTTECGEGVDVVSGDECLVDGVCTCQSARVGVLHDDCSGLLEVHTDVECLVHVEDVVVGELLTVKLLHLGDGGTLGERICIECGLLVGVLSVPEVHNLLGRNGEGCRESAFTEPSVHLECNHVVVIGSRDECLCHEPCEKRLLKTTVTHLFENRCVLLGCGDDCDGPVVLGGCTNHAGATDIDVLDDVLKIVLVLEYGLLEGIEVDYDHVDGSDSFLRNGTHVLREIPPCEKSTVDHGVEGLDTTVQHLGESSNIRDLDDGNIILFQKFVGSAGGDDLDTECGQIFSKIYDTGLIRHTDEGSLYCNCHGLSHYTP